MTTLLILGVPHRTVIGLLGWSTPTMQKRYMHLTETVRHDVADQLNQYFWKGN